MSFDTGLLQAFVAVHQANGFTRAAQQLHLSQSAVSHQIRRLEDLVGRPLFHRTTRRLGLTADGEEFLGMARRILEAQDALARHFRCSPIEGTVRLGLPESFMSDSLPLLLRQFSRNCPKVRLEVSVGLTLDLGAMVRDRELDLAVVVAQADRGPQGTLLQRQEMVWAAAEDFVPSDHTSWPLAYSPPPCVCRQIATDALNEAGVAWHSAFSSHSLHDLRAVVLSGLAVAPFTRDNLRPGMVMLDEREGLPALPALDFIMTHAEADMHSRGSAAAELGRILAAAASAPPDRTGQAAT
jgi:DNA-binding transcriptional LysR family regulator